MSGIYMDKNGNFKVERNGLLKWLDNLSGSKGNAKSKRSSKWEKNLKNKSLYYIYVLSITK